MQSTGGGKLSITVKLPILIGGLLVVAVLVYSAVSYEMVRQSTIRFAAGHLGTVAEQFSAAFHQNQGTLITRMRSAADTAIVTRFLTGPTAANGAAVTALLRPDNTAGKQVASLQVFDTTRRLLLAAGDSRAQRTAAAATEDLLRGLTPRDSGVVGHFLVVGDSVIYPAATPSVVNGRVLGYLVIWRYLVTTAQARQQVSKIIGASAHLYLGNSDNNIWSDLGQPVAPPPVAMTGDTSVLRYVRPGPDGGAMIATARPVGSTPWLLLVEFPMATVLAPAAMFLRDSLLIGAVILALGLLVAWIASHRITSPLVRLTRKAEELAGQHLPGPEGEAEGDEIVRLETAFDSMVAHVRESQRELETRVKTRTTELQERNEELESFAYSISHDLRAPLRAMDGFSQALLEEYGDTLDANGRQYAERVKAGARRMDLLIRDLLAYSKMTRADIKVGPIELERVIRSALEQVEVDARTRGARVVVDEHLPPVLGHESTLTQVVMNLLANGIKFVPADRVPELRIRTESRDGVVRLWILDNGIGIPREYHERIFRVFERLHRVDEYPGTGIGLAIVRKGVERMGGRVGLESEPDRGTSFWIDLPRVQDQGRGAAAAP